MITESDKGWMAAVLDMKGHVYHKETQARARSVITVTVDSSKPEVIRRLAELTGGNLDRARSAPMDWVRRGCSEHCPDQHIHMPAESKPSQRWAVNGVSAAIVLHNVIPFMRTDSGFREAYAEALAAVTGYGQGFGAVMPAVTRLARLGWVLPDFLMQKMLEGAERGAGALAPSRTGG